MFLLSYDFYLYLWCSYMDLNNVVSGLAVASFDTAFALSTLPVWFLVFFFSVFFVLLAVGFVFIFYHYKKSAGLRLKAPMDFRTSKVGPVDLSVFDGSAGVVVVKPDSDVLCSGVSDIDCQIERLKSRISDVDDDIRKI